MRSRTSGISSSSPADLAQAARRRTRSRCSLNFGTSASDRPSASSSRGPAVPSVSFASRRSRSSTLASSLRDFRPRDGGSAGLPRTASSRASISSSCKQGRSSRCAQHAPAHAGAGLIQHMNQRRLPRFAREQRLQQFQIAHRDRVQDHRLAAIVRTTAGPDDPAPISACRAGSAGSRPPPKPPAACRPARSHPASAGGNVRAARGRRSPG